MALYPFWRYVVTPIYTMWLRETRGINNIPRTPFIVAANHSSYYDTLLPHFLIIPITEKKMHAMVNANYWKIPVARQVLDHGECIPLYVRNEGNAKKKNENSFEEALNYLKKGETVLMFPEGTRSFDGKLKKAHTGIARLAIKSKVPILPFGIIDSSKVLPKGKLFPRLRRCKVNIGKPITLEKYYKKSSNKKVLENATRDIMKKIAKLIGQKYNY